MTWVVKEIMSDNPNPPVVYFQHKNDAEDFCTLLKKKFESLHYVVEREPLPTVHESVFSAAKEFGLKHL